MSVQAEQSKLLRVSRPAHELGLHPLTVRTWIKQGMIQAVRVGSEARVVQRSEIERLVERIDERLIVLYGRVSRQGQRSDLDTQLARLQVWAKHERVGKQIVVLSDSGSGLSATLRKLQRLLGLVRADQVAAIVVTHPDRLTRFGQEYLQALFESFDVALTVLDSSEDKTAAQELTDDLLAVLASFSGRLYGMRSHKQQELLTCTQAVLTNS